MARKKDKNSNVLEIQNAAKTLLTNIRFVSVDNPVKSVVVTSSIPNEGKTTISVELAKAVATSGKSAVLVETDMRRRSLAGKIGKRASAGLYGVLSGQVPLEKAVVETSVKGIFFLDAEPSIPNPVDIIGSKRFRALSQKLAASYDYVIYDAPPVGTFVDAAVLSTVADGVIFVVRTDFVKRDAVVHAYEQLQKAEANVIGICATFVEGSGSEYYYAYYTEDGKRVKNGEAASKAAPTSAFAPTSTSAGGFSKRTAASLGGQSYSKQSQQTSRSSVGQVERARR